MNRPILTSFPTLTTERLELRKLSEEDKLKYLIFVKTKGLTCI